MNQIYDYLGVSKQSVHQKFCRDMYKQSEQQQLLHLVRQVREDHPRMSARDIYLKLRPQTIGRDRFELLCAEHGFKVQHNKNYRKTTNSLGVTRFSNHLKEIEVTGVNQAFVSDITYYEMNSRFYYLTFIMDLYNRQIVGYHVSNNLRTENTTLPALHRLIKLRGSENLKGAIFHSDGGGQYYSNDFKQLTRKLGLINSMAEEVYENSHAERLNGIIKNNYLYPYHPKTFNELKKYLKKAVRMYNYEKPHRALNGKTPMNYLIN
ncbi:MAG: integrase [Bacteroidetes bacterium]|nr:integrase [Bacteroidota bacterium]MBC36115.1 integrase [Bacteroidota bacterium]|tara:strand:+ start:309 stop:1100 length:792 start_codon:yes stop_codon:yes gene_type:complete